MEILWRSRWKTVLKLPLSDAKPVSSSLPFTSQAARIKYGVPAGKTADAAFLWSTLNPSLPSFLACFFFFLLSNFVSSKPVTFLLLRILPIFSLLCTTWNFEKFHTFLSVFLSLHSCCPLIRSDEALWRNVIFSIKNFEKSKPRNLMQASNFGGTFDQLFLWFFFMKFSQKMALNFYTTVQKSQEWPKTQIKGSCLKTVGEDVFLVVKNKKKRNLSAWASSWSDSLTICKNRTTKRKNKVYVGISNHMSHQASFLALGLPREEG